MDYLSPFKKSRRFTMKKLINVLLNPFGNFLWLFLCIWLFTSAADLYFNSIHDLPLFGCYMACHGFILSYFITLICQFFTGTAGRIIRGILLALGVINLITDTFTHSIMHFGFTARMVNIILGSNVREASEFLPMYLTGEVVIFLVIVLLISFAIYWYCRKHDFKTKRWVQICLLAASISFSFIIVFRHSNNWEGLFLMKVKTFLEYDAPVNLKDYSSTPEIIIQGQQPDNIVLVIGESHAKGHCSLYGYDKNTQPLLGSMFSDSLLIKFNDAHAPYTHTTESIKSLLSTYKTSSKEGSWYLGQTFLMDVMKASGYDTYWISNQSSAGLYDNIIVKYAELADNVIWTTNKGFGYWEYEYDEVVLPIIDSIVAQGNKKFIVVNLMGSHENFSSRYPQSYSVFHAEDYPELPTNQRDMVAEYDNSILYNDYVVSSIFKMFDTGCNMAIYLPDHALDIYVSDPSFCGHARNDSVSFLEGLKIPLLFCPSDEYKVVFPEIIEKLKEERNNTYKAEDLIYTIAVLANCQFNKP